MRNEETGGLAQLPDIDAWRARGWAPCDAPEDTDPALAGQVADLPQIDQDAVAAADVKKSPKKGNSDG